MDADVLGREEVSTLPHSSLPRPPRPPRVRLQMGEQLIQFPIEYANDENTHFTYPRELERAANSSQPSKVWAFG